MNCARIQAASVEIDTRNLCVTLAKLFRTAYPRRAAGRRRDGAIVHYVAQVSGTNVEVVNQGKVDEISARLPRPLLLRSVALITIPRIGG